MWLGSYNPLRPTGLRAIWIEKRRSWALGGHLMDTRWTHDGHNDGHTMDTVKTRQFVRGQGQIIVLLNKCLR